MKILSAHLPEYFPTIDFFRKLFLSDIFIITDNLQFSKNNTINRALIKSGQNSKWLTIPVLKKGKGVQKINEVSIDPSSNWNKKHIKDIASSYKNAPYFEKYFPVIRNILSENWKKLFELTLKIIDYFISDLQIEKQILLGSNLSLNDKAENLIPQMLKKTECDTYIIENDYENYLRNVSEKININFIEFKPIYYRQLGYSFIPGLSIIDLLFNHGRESKNFLLET